MEHQQWVDVSTISRLLNSKDWTHKCTQHVASQRDRVARMLYLEDIAEFDAEQLVFLDESYASDKLAIRKRGWAPRGAPALDEHHYHHAGRFSILPAYTIYGYLDNVMIEEGSIDSTKFKENLILNVLPQCNAYPAARSVLVMDNCSTHNRDYIRELCRERGVLVRFLPSYSPDFNPIEISFSQLKHWIRKNAKMMPEYGVDD